MQGLVGALILVTALLSVGLTAASDGPFSIVIHPAFLRLGIDVDVKIGSVHLRASWSALEGDAAASSSAPSTKSVAETL